MWLILPTKPDDYVLASGRKHKVRHLVERAFAETGVKIAWEGTGTTRAATPQQGGS